MQGVVSCPIGQRCSYCRSSSTVHVWKPSELPGKYSTPMVGSSVTSSSRMAKANTWPNAFGRPLRLMFGELQSNANTASRPRASLGSMRQRAWLRRWAERRREGSGIVGRSELIEAGISFPALKILAQRRSSLPTRREPDLQTMTGLPRNVGTSPVGLLVLGDGSPAITIHFR